MCYHYGLSISSEDLFQRYSAFESDYALLNELYGEPIFHANGFAHPKMPVVTTKGIAAFRWGLIPSWTRSREEAAELSQHTLNARSETAFEKPSFRESISRRRCLVPASGFFEWRTLNGKKYPYFIRLKDEPVFSMAGIWDEWVDVSTGEIVNSFSILTTAANPLMEMIHNTKKRMPVILPGAQEAEWLKEDLSQENIRSLCQAFDEQFMNAYTIARLTAEDEAKDPTSVLQHRPYPELETKQGELF
jgi:putative SOS response-associated peptidase YedK